MEVEVFARSNDNEACGWWRAVIKVLLDLFGICLTLTLSTWNMKIKFTFPDDERRVSSCRIQRLGK